MKTYNVTKTERNEKGQPVKSAIVGTVTAYKISEAMNKAAKKFNNGNWTNIYVTAKKYCIIQD
jgi:hypothetical protein